MKRHKKVSYNGEYEEIRWRVQKRGSEAVHGGGEDGQTWFPQEPQTLQAQPTPDGQKMAMIPNLINKKMLRIKLRDYPKQDITQSGFVFANTVKPLNQLGQNPSRKMDIPQNQMPQAATSPVYPQPTKPKVVQNSSRKTVKKKNSVKNNPAQ